MSDGILNWVSLLPEVGAPIRDAAQMIDDMRKKAAEMLDLARRHEETLMARIAVNWEKEDIYDAKLNAKCDVADRRS